MQTLYYVDDACTMDIKSLWPRNPICQYSSVSTLAQVMACCLRATSHYLKAMWTYQRCSGEQCFKVCLSLFHNVSSEITFLKCFVHLPGVSEVNMDCVNNSD